jgi:hypothetical protein
MHDRDIISESLREDGVEPTEDQINRVDADLTKLADILFNYLIEQKRYGRKISDPYPVAYKTNERDNLLSSVNKGTSGRNKS